MLTNSEKLALREEEIFRKSVRDEIQGPKSGLFSGENLKWIATTVAIPLAVWVATSIHEEAQTAIADGRKEIDQLTALLPELSKGDPTALAVLSDMQNVRGASKTVHEIYASVNKRAQDQQKSGDPAQAAAGAATRAILLENSRTPPEAPTGDAPVSSAPSVAVNRPTLSLAAAIRPETYVYTQIYWEGQRANAAALSSALRQQGVPVLGIQNVMKGRTADQLKFAQRGAVDIRFYHPEDKAAALALVPVIRSVAPSFGEPTIHDLSARSAQGKSGTLEIWYPCAAKGAACAPEAGQLDFSDPKNSGLLPLI